VISVNGTWGSEGGSYAGTLNFSPMGGAVPEPASWALMIAGVGMAGGALRRRRVSTKVSFA
ncbi:MAG: PEP-CTERM sorting domain-containing protein, partial [Oxalobacteraceae bacterium]